jgi:hypothetical protein
MENTILINHIEVTRKRFAELVTGLPEDRLNAIPDGFSNNIGWNFAHVIVTQQLLTNGLSDIPFAVPQPFIDAYRKGTKPEAHISKQELESFLEYSDLSLASLREGLENGSYQHFNSYTTSYGVELHSLEEALRFVPIHEAMHLGMCMARAK